MIEIGVDINEVHQKYQAMKKAEARKGRKGSMKAIAEAKVNEESEHKDDIVRIHAAV